MTAAVADAPVVAPDAPAAPSGWGRPVDPAATATYLERLGAWRAGRRAELDALDAAALASGGNDVTADVTLAMAVFQTVATRHDELLRVWAGGRVGPVELSRLSALVWGRTDPAATAGGAAGADPHGVSLPEACRLSDAVTAQLRQRLALTTVGGDVVGRLTALRASAERVRDLVDALPAGSARDASTRRLADVDRRLTEVTERARRGADVGGQLGPLDSDVATAERDLIVAGARARDDARDLARATAWRAGLAARATRLEALVEQCVAAVVPAPVLGVPRVDALGPVPADADAVDAYLVRLDAVERALAHAEATYQAPLREVEDLRGLLGATDAQAVARGREGLPEVGALAGVAAEVLAARPVDLPRARALVAAYRVLLDAAPPAVTPPAGPARPASSTAPGRSS